MKSFPVLLCAICAVFGFGAAAALGSNGHRADRAGPKVRPLAGLDAQPALVARDGVDTDPAETDTETEATDTETGDDATTTSTCAPGDDENDDDQGENEDGDSQGG